MCFQSGKHDLRSELQDVDIEASISEGLDIRKCCKQALGSACLGTESVDLHDG
jgi:hypothetical protein